MNNRVYQLTFGTSTGSVMVEDEVSASTDSPGYIPGIWRGGGRWGFDGLGLIEVGMVLVDDFVPTTLVDLFA